MAYRIEHLDLFVRETPPNRMSFSLGKQGRKAAAVQATTNPLVHVRLVLKDSTGQKTFGTAADRLSVRWLDKRPGRSKPKKLRELVSLIGFARDLYQRNPQFELPFDYWRHQHVQIMREGDRRGQEKLSSSFASALFERAVLDAVSRLADKSIHEMVVSERLGFHPGRVFPELRGLNFKASLPSRPRTRFYIRHTVGASDPLTAADLPDARRVNDGLPETLEEYIRDDGVRYFKVKITGDVQRDFDRLSRVWDVVSRADEPAITLDANESYGNLADLKRIIDRCEQDLTGFFQHVMYIEQPLPRALTLDPATRSSVRALSQKKLLIIDEADDALDSYKRARAIGYQGTSHKNCKGFFKSLINHSLVVQSALQGREEVLSGEDLQNLPVVPLHQDFVALGILGLEHCERNGHHYNFGLSFLSERDKAHVVKRHPDLYHQRGTEWFLKVDRGQVDCASLQCPGFGVSAEPDWPSMVPMDQWIRQRYPA
ncbi:MAG: enolase C-terminal domain-like protein [Planctomycetaceae bacterium]